MVPTYKYRASLIRVIDGDTYVMRVDLGFFVEAKLHIRLRGIDLPERYTVEGKEATALATKFLESATQLVVETYKDQQTFGRWVADVYVDGQSLVSLLTPPTSILG